MAPAQERGVRLRHARRRDLSEIVEVWVAFANDPYLRWIEPDDARWPAFVAAWMTFVVELTFERGHPYLADPPDVAVAWIPPDLSFVGPDDVARGRAIIAEYAGDARADDALATILAARARALEESNWTLQYIGVHSARRGGGLGAAAVNPLLGVCDDEGLPCGLVSTSHRNVSFYERLGFRVDAEIATPDGAAVMRPMHRPPSATSSS
jgi:GNAT superfamily N-acetyltransferase